MEVWQALEFIWDSQIEPFIELNMGLDLIIGRFRADFVRGVTGIRASRGYTQLPKNSFMVNFFADKDNVVAGFISSSYYESFMQVLESLFSRLCREKWTVAQGNRTLGKALLPCSLLSREEH